jgi:hypothetical protein
MHILWLSLRIQSHNAQNKKQGCLHEFNDFDPSYRKRMVWLSNVMINQKTYSKGLSFAYLKKEKMIFLKTDKNTTLQRKVSTPQK